MGNISFSEKGWEDFNYWQTQDKKTMKRILQLITDIQRNHYEGIGKPEPLKHELQGYWSRRIDDTNRLVYKIEGDTVQIIQCKNHYND